MRTELLLASLGILGSSALAAPPPKSKPGQIPAVTFKDLRLKNGLRVLLAEDHSAPTYSICVTYNVGSRDERKGRTGFAHLFEHMMFQGSENVGKGEHFVLIQNNGGGMNGTTSEDRTNYFEALPANQLDLGLFLEADRMRSLVINQANLDNQRNAVREERRLGVDNRAYGRTEEVIPEVAYDNFAYKHSTIGSMEDLNAATLADVSAFFKTYYAPNNAVLTLVGDFKSDEALAKVKQHFESIPSQKAPAAPDMKEPPQKGERRREVEDPFAQTPRLDIVFKIPPGNTADWYAMHVAMSILGAGQSSRLYQRLVKDGEVAVMARADADERRGTSLAGVEVMARPGKDLKQIEALVYEEIDRLGKEPAADWELEKVRRQLRRQRVGGLQSTMFRAIQLGEAAVFFNDPNLINTFEAKYVKVGKEDVRRVVKKYLVKDNRTVVTTLPRPAAPAAGAPAAADPKAGQAPGQAPAQAPGQPAGQPAGKEGKR